MSLTRKHQASYGMMMLPLAFAGLPLYVFAPKFYSDHAGIPLAALGAILLLCRMIDALVDPLFGWFGGRYCCLPGMRRAAIALGLVIMSAGFAMLFHPPEQDSAMWFFVCMIITLAGYSFASINYYALGSALSRGYREQSSISAWREGAGLAGVLVACILPTVLGERMSEREAFDILSWVLMGLTVLCVLTLYSMVPGGMAKQRTGGLSETFLPVFQNREFHTLALIYFVNCIAASIPAVTMLYFVDDVLRAHDQAGFFLALYFISGAVSMPFWTRLIGQIGKRRAWMASMLLALGAFVWAFFLGAGDLNAFSLICVASGIAFGADLAIPPSMLSDTLLDREDAAVYFGAWGFLAKLGLALATGLSLVLLEFGGYTGKGDLRGLSTLSYVYALLPCAFKSISFLMLTSSKLDRISRLG